MGAGDVSNSFGTFFSSYWVTSFRLNIRDMPHLIIT